MLEWIESWSIWIASISLLMFIGSLWLVSWLLIRLPHDYFLKERFQVPQLRSPTSTFFYFARHAVGLILILMGLVMIITPGQGILTILLGITLIEFPGKDSLVRWILQRESLRKTINWLRQKAHKPPLIFERNQSAAERHESP